MDESKFAAELARAVENQEPIVIDQMIIARCNQGITTDRDLIILCKMALGRLGVDLQQEDPIKNEDPRDNWMEMLIYSIYKHALVKTKGTT